MKHPNWGKKRIAQWIWKENGWERVVAIETVRNVLNRHGMWKNGKKKNKRNEEWKRKRGERIELMENNLSLRLRSVFSDFAGIKRLRT